MHFCHLMALPTYRVAFRDPCVPLLLAWQVSGPALKIDFSSFLRLYSNKEAPTYQIPANPIIFRYSKLSSRRCTASSLSHQFNNPDGVKLCKTSAGSLPHPEPNVKVIAPSLYSTFTITLNRNGLTEDCRKKSDEFIKRTPVSYTHLTLPTKA